MKRFFILLCFFFFSSSVYGIGSQFQKITGKRNISKMKTSIKSGLGSVFFPIYSHQWFDLMPWFSEGESLLLIHRIFVVSFSRERGFPDWIAYELNPQVVWGSLKSERVLKSDPLLVKALKSIPGKMKEPLTPKDYKGASAFGYDRGHLAPKGSFKGSLFAFEAQYMTNIVPQRRDLNQGPWRVLEERIRQFVLEGNRLKVLTGPLYGEALKEKTPYKNPLPPWPQAQGKISEVPTGFWKMVFREEKSNIKVCAFLMPQDLGGFNRKTSPEKFIVKVQLLQQHLPLKEKWIEKLKENCRFLY